MAGMLPGPNQQRGREFHPLVRGIGAAKNSPGPAQGENPGVVDQPRPLDKLKNGVLRRTSIAPKKRGPEDFVLWKKKSRFTKTL